MLKKLQALATTTLILALLTLTACQPVTKLIVLLFDFSASTKDQAARQKYKTTFDEVFATVAAGDIIVADAISDNPLTQSTFPLNEILPEAGGLLGNPLIEGKKLKEQKTAIIEKAAAFLNEPHAGRYTKLLDALLLADRIFNTPNYQRSKKILVVCSDMIEESERYNFQTQSLSPADIKRIIEVERKDNRLPNLAGVKVYVVGAGAGAYRRNSSAGYQAVQSFWLSYFKASGADLSGERYGASLLEFNE